LLLARTRETGYFFAQFAPQHTMRYRGQWSLLDLEGVYLLRDLPWWAELHFSFEDADYLEGVAELYRRSCCNDSGESASSQIHAVAAGAGKAILHGNGLLRRYWTRPARRVALRFRNLLAPRTHLIEGCNR
jgi:hypothetical protein